MDLNLACGLGAELFEGANLFDFEFVTRKEEFSIENGLAPVGSGLVGADATLENGRKTPDWMKRGSLFWMRRPSAQLAMLHQQQVAAMQGHHTHEQAQAQGQNGPMSPSEAIAGLGLSSPQGVSFHHPHAPAPAPMENYPSTFAVPPAPSNLNGHPHPQAQGQGMMEADHNTAMNWDMDDNGRRRSSMAGDLFTGPAGGLLNYNVAAMQGLGLVV
jgi:hypothetical protein